MMHNNKYGIRNRAIWCLLLVGLSRARPKDVESKETSIEGQNSPIEEAPEAGQKDDKISEPASEEEKISEPASEEEKQTEEVPEVLRRLRDLTNFIERCNSMTPQDAIKVFIEIADKVNEELQMVESVKHMCQEVRSTCRYFVGACSIAAFIGGTLLSVGIASGIVIGQHLAKEKLVQADGTEGPGAGQQGVDLQAGSAGPGGWQASLRLPLQETVLPCIIVLDRQGKNVHVGGMHGVNTAWGSVGGAWT